MKKLFFIPVAVPAVFLMTAFTGAALVELSIGSSLPKGDVKMLNVISNQETTLAQLKKENGLAVIFSCNTCPFVIKSEIIIKEISKLSKESKVGYVLLNSNEAQREGEDSKDEMKIYARKQGYDFPYLIDKNSEVADAFGATRTPQVFLFDKDMKLVYKGAYTDDSNPANATKFFFKDAINSLKDGKEIPVSSSKSFGCTIKRVKK